MNLILALNSVVGRPQFQYTRSLGVSAVRFNRRGPTFIPGRVEHQSVSYSDIVNFFFRC